MGQGHPIILEVIDFDLVIRGSLKRKPRNCRILKSDFDSDMQLLFPIELQAENLPSRIFLELCLID